MSTRPLPLLAAALLSTVTLLAHAEPKKPPELTSTAYRAGDDGPAVSPDGRFVWFVTDVALAIPGAAAGDATIVVDRMSGTTKALRDAAGKSLVPAVKTP